MIELIQIPWSPYCRVQHRILEHAGAAFKTVNVTNMDRSLVWRVTRGRYYQVPVVRDGRTAIFETAPDSQVIAKYLDVRFQLGLFPRDLEGVQSILWRHIEDELEGCGFRLNDIYWREFVPVTDHAGFVQHKERKFGRGCLEAWRDGQRALLAEFGRMLLPFEQMLDGGPFLLGERPRFVDFDLYGILGNFLYSGHYRLPAAHARLRRWHRRMARI